MCDVGRRIGGRNSHPELHRVPCEWRPSIPMRTVIASAGGRLDHLSSKSVGSSADGVSITSRPRCIAWVIRCARLRALSLRRRSEEHTSELQSLMRNSYAVFCLKKNKHKMPNAHDIEQST